MNEQAVIAVESQKVTDAFPEDLLALLHQYSNNAGQNLRRNPLTHPGRPISRPHCLLLPLLRAFLDIVLSKQRILIIHVPLTVIQLIGLRKKVKKRQTRAARITIG